MTQVVTDWGQFPLETSRAMGNQPGQGGVIVEDQSCAQRVCRGLAVAAGEQRKRNAGTLRGLDIHFAVTDKQRLARTKCRRRRFR